MNKPILLIFLVTSFLGTAYAEKLVCPPYLGDKNNTLFNMGPVGSQTDYFNPWKGEDIVPDRETEKGNVLIQYFYPSNHKSYKKLFLVCVYKDKGYIVKNITSGYKECMGTYGGTADSMLFECL